jgi:hypothetical protein
MPGFVRALVTMCYGARQGANEGSPCNNLEIWLRACCVLLHKNHVGLLQDFSTLLELLCMYVICTLGNGFIYSAMGRCHMKAHAYVHVGHWKIM